MKTQNSMILCDDGTMDTVVECPHCGCEERHSEADRDSDGCVVESWLVDAYENRMCNCEAEPMEHLPTTGVRA